MNRCKNGFLLTDCLLALWILMLSVLLVSALVHSLSVSAGISQKAGGFAYPKLEKLEEG